jgi:hypothetical protein
MTIFSAGPLVTTGLWGFRYLLDASYSLGIPLVRGRAGKLQTMAIFPKIAAVERKRVEKKRKGRTFRQSL